MFKKMIGLLLALTLTLSLSACSTGGKNTSGQENTAVYAEEEIGSPSGLKWPNGSRINSKNQLVVFDKRDGIHSGFVTLDQQGLPVENSEVSFSGDVRAFALDAEDNIYILTTEFTGGKGPAQRLTVLSPGGEIIKTYDLGTISIEGGNGMNVMANIGYTDIAVDTGKNIYLCNPSKSIEVLDKDGDQVRTFVEKGYESIDIDSDGNVIAASLMEKRAIEKLEAASGKSLWSVDLPSAGGMFMMGTNKVRFSKGDQCLYFLTDQGITKYDANGKLIGTAIDFQAYTIKASGYTISDMAIDAQGNIYVTTVSELGGGVRISMGPGPKGAGGPGSQSSNGMPEPQAPDTAPGNQGSGAITNEGPDILPAPGGSDTLSGQGPDIMDGKGPAPMDIKCELYKYSKQAGGVKAQKQEIITVSVPFSNRALEMAASKFQKENPGYRIEIQSFSGQDGQNGDYETYLKNLNTQILSGKGPDIMSVAGMPFKSYISKNILADLSEMIANDKSFDLSKYYTNIFDALKYDGKLYVLPADFTFDVMMANQEILDQLGIKIDDSSWTWNDFKQIAEKVSQKDADSNDASRAALPALSGTELLNLFTNGSYSNFIDSGMKKAYFTSQGFVDLLNTVKVFSDDSLTDGNIKTDMISILEAAGRGSIVFYPNAVSEYNMYSFIKAAFKEHLSLYNIPTQGGFNGGTFSSNTIYAISRNSRYKPASWEFLKTLISDEVQSQQFQASVRPAGEGAALKSPGGFSINKSVEQKKAQQAIEETQSDRMKMMMTSPNGSIELSPARISQADIDYINKFISGLNKYADYDTNISGIIEDETKAFFSGNKSAEETASLIQNRVNTYLGE